MGRLIVGQLALPSQYKDFAAALFRLFYPIVMSAQRVIPRLRALGPYYSILLSLWIVQDWKYYGSCFPSSFFWLLLSSRRKKIHPKKLAIIGIFSSNPWHWIVGWILFFQPATLKLCEWSLFIVCKTYYF